MGWIMFGGFRLLLILASLFLLTAIVSAADSSSAAAPGPPKAAVQPVEDTWHGHKIVDNYRWLEDGTTPQTKEGVRMSWLTPGQCWTLFPGGRRLKSG